MPFVQDPFRPVDNKNKLVAAFIQTCPTCEATLAKKFPYSPYTDPRRVELISKRYLALAYYLEWDPKYKQARACFGTLSAEPSYQAPDHLSRTALFKRAPGKPDWDRFGRKDFGQDWTAFEEHVDSSHFDPNELSRMLATPGYLPAGASAWTYWVQDPA